MYSKNTEYFKICENAYFSCTLLISFFDLLSLCIAPLCYHLHNSGFIHTFMRGNTGKITSVFTWAAVYRVILLDPSINGNCFAYTHLKKYADT